MCYISVVFWCLDGLVLLSLPPLGKRFGEQRKEGDRCGLGSARIICVNVLGHAGAGSHAAGGREGC